MQAQEISNRILREYSRAAGGNLIELNEQGTAVVRVNKDVSITLYLGERADSLIFLAEVTSLIPDPRDDAMIRSLLTHAFPGYRTRGGALLINAADNTLVYSYERKLEGMDERVLDNIIGNFSESVIYFREKAMQARFQTN